MLHFVQRPTQTPSTPSKRTAVIPATMPASRPRSEKAMPTTDVDGSRVAYVETGSGETVLLLHSSASTGAQWRSLMEILRPHWRVLVPDLYGYGETDRRPDPGLPGLAGEVALVDAVLGD